MFLSLLLIIIYIEVSHFFVACGGMSSKLKFLEFPILLLTLFLLYEPSIKISKNILLSVISILGTYLSFDIFYYFLARSPRLSDFYNVSILSDFSLLISIGFISISTMILVPIFYIIYEHRKVKIKTNSIFLAIKILILTSLIAYSSPLSQYIIKKFHYISWSQELTIKKNGRFSSFIYSGIKSNQAKQKLIAYKNTDIDVNKIIFKNHKIKNKRNVYIVVLESFIDPRLIKDVSFNRSPLSKDMKKYLFNNEFSYVKSPIYGGGTAQAEFEILTGIKALSKIDSIEFNVLDSHQISGFVDMLKQNGYETYATIASSPKYFNSKSAYKSIGFDKVSYLEQSDDFKINELDSHIFDGDVYDYNIKKLKQDKIKKPYIYYTLGMYGHFPYNRNIKDRPNKITTSHKDKRVEKIANQFYYRTKALAKYISNIIAIDPQSIIYISSDHIPPLLNNGIEYKKSKRTNISLLVINGKSQNIAQEYYYNIPRLIYQELSHKGNVKPIKVEKMIEEKMYFKVLSESLYYPHH